MDENLETKDEVKTEEVKTEEKEVSEKEIFWWRFG